MHIRPSWRTHAFYRTAIVPAVRDYCGYERDTEAHRALKAGFYELHPDDPKLPSMADMSQEESGRFIEFAFRQCAELGLVLPDPARRARGDRAGKGALGIEVKI
jgi:hypothetical protein